MNRGRIGRVSALGGLAAAAWAAVPAPALPTEAGCQVVLVARGRLRDSIVVQGSAVTLQLRFSQPLTLENPQIRGSQAACDRPIASGTLERDDATEVLQQVAQTIYDELANQYQNQTVRPTQFIYRELGNVTNDIRGRLGWGSFLAEVDADATRVIAAFLQPTALLTDEGARLVAEATVAEGLRQHLRGAEQSSWLNGFVQRIAAQIAGKPRFTASTLTGADLEVALSLQVLRILEMFQREVVQSRPGSESLRWEYVDAANDCTHSLDLFWTFFGGRFRATLEVRCGQPPGDVISRVAVTVPPPQPPGGGGAVTITAFNQHGTPFPLDQAEVEGLADVMPDGSGEPKAVIAGATATFNFTIGKPRRDADFPIQLRIWTTPASGGFSTRARATISVYNVSPDILDVTPDTLRADPGMAIGFADARVLLRDDNADRFNGFEVTATSLKLAHPAGLDARPRFDAVDNSHFVSHDDASGRYVFAFSRGSKVQLPHPHGTFTGRLEMSDNDGNAAIVPLTYVVRDVPPRFASAHVTPQYVHTGDGQRIAVTLSVEDPNGADDITAVALDATAAGGGRYAIGQGLTVVRRTPSGLDLRIDPPFPHTDAGGYHTLSWRVTDETGTVTDTSFIHVGNDPPIIHGYGYLYGPDSIPAADDSLRFVEVPPARLCPLQHLSAGIIASDPEQDRFTVEGVIVETGQRVPLEHSRGRSWIAHFDAPSRPGHYTLKISVTEIPPENTTAISLPIDVVPCDSAQQQQQQQQMQDGGSPVLEQEQQQEVELADPATPQDVAHAPADLKGQKEFAAMAGGVVAPVSLASSPTQGGPSVADLADSIALVLSGVAGPDAPPLESYLLATGGSTGPVAQLFAINQGGKPLRLPRATMVVEPVAITPAIQARVGELLQRYLAAGGRGLTLEMYCLERLRLPPAGGTLLRIVSGDAAAPFQPFTGVLDAATRVRDALGLHPDSDPEEYFHAIRQWALWSAEERFDAARFGDAFVATTRHALEAAGQRWDRDVERQVRALVPNRWSDVQAVLREADLALP